MNNLVYLATEQQEQMGWPEAFFGVGALACIAIMFWAMFRS